MLAATGTRAYVMAMRALLRLGIVLGVLAAGSLVAHAQGGFESFERSAATIETASGAKHHFDIELAVTPRQQAQGLMHRRNLDPEAGMLFVYPRDGPVTMWMKNTLIPLDMLFLARDGRIVQVVKRAVPLSLATISSDQAVAGVLEVNGGTVDRLGIAAGDRVIHPALGGES